MIDNEIRMTRYRLSFPLTAAMRTSLEARLGSAKRERAQFDAAREAQAAKDRRSA